MPKNWMHVEAFSWKKIGIDKVRRESSDNKVYEILKDTVVHIVGLANFTWVKADYRSHAGSYIKYFSELQKI
jgi:hypothetical protein